MSEEQKLELAQRIAKHLYDKWEIGNTGSYLDNYDLNNVDETDIVEAILEVL